MRVLLRLIWLHSLARLRTAGLLPWLLTGGWLLIARLQEPTLLRSYGIAILGDAAWTAGVLLLCVLCLVETRRPRRAAWASNLVVLLVLSATMAPVVWALDHGVHAEPFAYRIAQATAFFASWVSLALVLASPFPCSTWGRILAVLIALAAGLFGSMLSVAFRSDPGWGAALGAVLAAAAGAMGGSTIRAMR